ncbi:dihydropteroate synthase [Lacisediminimonas sp.]|uniref:dihydropteroate synthase n=1 Tax=Lacisediminimonas sp. TaxID=3060582 RepID=UPI002724E298|nr:dihydropteroate synthase [Lacisediminimonas sp.]MDO8298908.1 dihydropteroate synthase [Lacisediminimonas sp.]MDO9218601.1 dihydropteroate synthase [Lacisediminimonas sp.]
MNVTFQCGRYRLPLDPRQSRPLVMGILNVTPDSFSDGGRFNYLESALGHAEQMIADGVDIIDIGGESTRPGAQVLSVAEELRRVLPVVFALRDCGKPLSVDTCKPEVMHEVLAAGADMINDINGFRSDGALRAIKDSDAALCIMHMQNEPGTMQQNPHYDDVVAEVTAFLHQRVDAIAAEGIAPQRMCVDPGFGFGKTMEHNLALLRRVGDIQQSLGLPLLAGLSRKSTLGVITGRPVEQRMAASVAAALVAAERGARIVRVHDVAQTVDALKVWFAVGQPATVQGQQQK